MNPMVRQKLLLEAENRLAQANKVVFGKLCSNFVATCNGKTIEQFLLRDESIFIHFQDGSYWRAKIVSAYDNEVYLSPSILEDWHEEAKLYATEEELAEVKASAANLSEVQNILSATNGLREMVDFFGKEAVRKYIDEL